MDSTLPSASSAATEPSAPRSWPGCTGRASDRSWSGPRPGPCRGPAALLTTEGARETADPGRRRGGRPGRPGSWTASPPAAPRRQLRRALLPRPGHRRPRRAPPRRGLRGRRRGRPVHGRLGADGGAARWVAAGRTAVLSAGALPGLSGLLPRAGRARRGPVRLEAYLGGVAPLTPAAAGDVLLARGPEHGVPAASWADGQVRDRALGPRRGLRLTAFPARGRLPVPVHRGHPARLRHGNRPDPLVHGLRRRAPRRGTRPGLGAGQHRHRRPGRGGRGGRPRARRLVRAGVPPVGRHGRRAARRHARPPRRRLLRAQRLPDRPSGARGPCRCRPARVCFAAEVLDPAATVRALAADPVAELETEVR
ncbi:hypothetical protein NKH77_04325 [Streptomyces sp. M19]